MYSLNDLKSGLAIVIDGHPHVVLKSQFSKQGRQGGVAATKLKNLKTGSVLSKTFQGSDKLEPADVGFRHVQFLFESGDTFTFMDLETYDQFELTIDTVGVAKEYLMEGLELDALHYEEKPIAIQLPPTVNLKVAETSPGLKGDTAQGGTKPATMETGLRVDVPLFVNEGDAIKVNTENGKYMERVS